MKNEFEKIKAAVLANRGGLTEATNQQIQTIWNTLPEAVQKQYLDSVKPKPQEKKQNA